MNYVSTTKVMPLSGGWFMVTPVSRAMAGLMYDNLDADELDELDAVKVDKDTFVNESQMYDRTAAFFAGSTLVFTICAAWVNVPWSDKPIRIWDTMSSSKVRSDGLVNGFVRHSREMRDAFMIGEPTDDVVGIVKSDFARSRKWIERCAEFKEHGMIKLYGVDHAVYGYKWEV